MTDLQRDARADRIAAQATGVGGGLVAMTLAWLVGARAFDLLWDEPGSAYLALGTAVSTGAVVTAWAMRRLVQAADRDETQASLASPGRRP
jgi:hypothetical protein